MVPVADIRKLDPSWPWDSTAPTRSSAPFASHWMMNGGCIFRLSKILGHSSVKITEKVYAHLAPTAFKGDYERVAFHVPSVPATVYDLKRDDDGRIVGRDAAVLKVAGNP